MPRRDRYPTELMCRILAVSRTGYYAWSNWQESVHARRDAELTAEIVKIGQECDVSNTASWRAPCSPRA